MNIPTFTRRTTGVVCLGLLASTLPAQTVPDRRAAVPLPRDSAPAASSTPGATTGTISRSPVALGGDRPTKRTVTPPGDRLQSAREARERAEEEVRKLTRCVSELERSLNAERAQRQAQPTLPTPAPATTAVLPPVPTPVASSPPLLAPATAPATLPATITLTTGRTTPVPTMVAIPPTGPQGFLMGSPTDEPNRYKDEKQHRVVINYSYAMGETEVTWDQWDACVADNACRVAGETMPEPSVGKGQNPVVYVSWNQSNAYADWLNRKLGLVQLQGDRNVHPHRFRLPSEAEWERAARAGNTGPFGFKGEANISPSLARYDWSARYRNSSTRDWEKSTLPVGSYAPNAFGLKDMHGNVWEWVADCYEHDYDLTPKKGSVHRLDDRACSFRVRRGGSWFDNPVFLRAAVRLRNSPTFRGENLGFRLARMLP